MPAVDANVIPGENTLLQVEIGSTFVTIAEVTEIDGPEVLVEAIDSTAINTGLIISRPSKFPEPDKLTLKIWFDPNDTNTQILFVQDTTTPGTIQSYKLEFNDTKTTHATATFHGFTTSFKLNGMKAKSNLGADVEIKLRDLPVYAAGTP
jgi:hypothetical protein